LNGVYVIQVIFEVATSFTGILIMSQDIFKKLQHHFLVYIIMFYLEDNNVNDSFLKKTLMIHGM